MKICLPLITLMSCTVNWNSRCVRKQNVFTLTLMRCDSISKGKVFAFAFWFSWSGTSISRQMFCYKNINKLLWFEFPGVRRHMENEFNFPFFSGRFTFCFSDVVFHNHTSVSLFLIQSKTLLCMNENVKFFVQLCIFLSLFCEQFFFAFSWSQLVGCMNF